MEDTEDEFQQAPFLHRAGSGANRTDPDPAGYYAILGVPQDASHDAIRRSFLYLSQVYHTDKHGGDTREIQQLMNERFQQLQEAYVVLSDERQRAAYDMAGLKGMNLFSLIPGNITLPEEVARYVALLEKEQEVLQLETMLASTSSLHLSYSLAHLFLPADANTAASPPATEEVEGDGGSAPAQATAAESAATSEEVGDAAKGAGPPSAPSGTDAADKTSPAPLQSAQMQAKLILLDGEERLVLIPSPEVEGMLRQKVAESRRGASQAPAFPARRRSQLTPMQKLSMAVMPREIFFENSFTHQLTPQLAMVFETTASHQGPKATVGCRGHLKYAPDAIRRYNASCSTSLQGLQVAFTRFRELSAVWTLKTKLLLLDGRSLLHRFEVSLTRKLSPAWSLKNTLEMFLTENGVFKASLVGVKDGLMKGFSAHMGYRQLGLFFHNGSPLIVNEEEEEEGGSKGIAFVTQLVSLFPLAGVGRVGFQAWYNTSEWQSIGVGFSTDLPLSMLPISYPRGSDGRKAVNTLTFLYKRKSHSIEIPVAAFISSQLQQVLLWLAAPWVCYRTARLVWGPFQRSRAATLYRQRRLEHQAEMDVARTRAMHEQKAVESMSLRNRVLEEKVSGLVIMNAKYGVLSPRYPESLCARAPGAAVEAPRRLPWWQGWRTRPASSPKSPAASDAALNTEEDAVASSILVLDVTVALQNFVRDSKLLLPAGTKSKLVGFTDPDPFTDEKKELKIVYRFQHRRHAVTFKDDEPVELPRREHLVE
ncbi:putative chaperone DNAJ protein [Trypanosoma conorhini]|uniref:Putative chaperone DNAJ protein n=1 Tax=Trypanosoma conorhini TaxID=83891 RepID=A0A422PB77_9TRYP|nr:putative chaperone DNAJ protein [Trypanosoma conorhini]RNF14956.1 putative chaperone DNAJ protein [Trypanosoma conorhini]